MVLGGGEGTTSAIVFEAYVEKVLAPSLRRGQIIVLDSLLSAHKSERTKEELIEERGCQLLLLYLPAYYSPYLQSD